VVVGVCRASTCGCGLPTVKGGYPARRRRTRKESKACRGRLTHPAPRPGTRRFEFRPVGAPALMAGCRTTGSLGGRPSGGGRHWRWGRRAR